ncbi:MAG: hypothetical protein GTO53_07080 [Planctomycetales bacterium]|nr:hypothetical protein [Planctomycetales bacterium]NIM08899.1 hypothetical protein [Planctomycetales bacterium]NIN08359.1 hypothetical protein [Planctomycetales bacterium]NIN77487.1 hypothetical protein [Planctomycetales bacterium]NIO34659.1 hypothetical protein [Planctomycetales bacterium]
MWQQIAQRISYLALTAALFLAGYLAGGYQATRPAEAQDRFGDEGIRQQWQAGFGFAIPAQGAALIRGQEGRSYLVTIDGKVEELSIGEGVRTPTPLRPR